MKRQIIYCYDAYCGWSYAFSNVILNFAGQHKNDFDFEVFSGGLILPEKPRPIAVVAPYFNNHINEVRRRTGVEFGKDFLWHIENPNLSDWFPDSLKPAVALAIFRELHPEKQLEFAADLGIALFAEGRDLCDDEAYRHLLEKYEINPLEFYAGLHSKTYESEAREDFEAVKAFGVSGYPAVLVQVNAKRFVRLSEGWIEAGELEGRLEEALKEQA